MSYELEAKKRKFDRILESLTDGGSSRTPLNARDTTSNATTTNGTSDASKRRRITPTAITKSASTTSLTGHYLPSSRPAFLERLATFRQVTQWHVPSTEPINAAVWAKRGWICIDRDTVFCGPCKERLTVDLDLENGRLHEPDATDEAADEEGYTLTKNVYDALIKRYSEMIVTAHADSCPWRKRGCSESIQRVEGLLNTNNAILATKERYNSIATDLTEVAKVSLPDKFLIEELGQTSFDDQAVSTDGLGLAMCGWQRKCADVVECKYCFRSLGLWLYRGNNPTIEKLDAVESHLEYCPWRDPAAQDSEVPDPSLSGADTSAKTIKLSGSELVYQAIVKTNAKKSGAKRPATAVTTVSSDDSLSEQTPEQREKRTRDLMKRIKELRKPFNLKALLRKKAQEKDRPGTAT
jgi:hypothetical protein